MIDTVLFDLDGTLLPIDQNEFIHAYFAELIRCMAPLGYKKDELISAVWKGTKAMVLNDGEKYNRERFWDSFSSVLGEQVRGFEGMLEDFYCTGFNNAKTVVKSDAGRDVRPLITNLRDKGYGIILATNPIFPESAVKSRLDWIGLHTDDFDMVTTYETCTYCKPNPQYYYELMRRASKDPRQCLMVGNNAKEDTTAAITGAEVFLLTDFLENEDNIDISRYTHGNFSELKHFIGDLPQL
ncbi:MAG: HAD family hydrolase [Oscillospiraceae bacterium]